MRPARETAAVTFNRHCTIWVLTPYATAATSADISVFAISIAASSEISSAPANHVASSSKSWFQFLRPR